MTDVTEAPDGRRSDKSGPRMAEVAPLDEHRRDLIRRTKRMSIEERIELFDRMSRDAAWAAGAKRAR